MSTLTTIQSTDLITNSRANINDNFSALNSDKMETSVLDTDTTLAANSDSKVPTQKAVKSYVDSQGFSNASTTVKGIVQEATQVEVDAGTTTGSTGARLYINPSLLRASIGWKLIASTTSASGTYTVTGIGSYSRIMIILKGVTSSAADARSITVSSDNGVSFYTTSGDYVQNGSNATAITVSGAATSAKNVFCLIENFNSAVTHKFASQGGDSNSNSPFIITRTEALNAIRVGTTNINGGSIHVYGI